MRPVSATEFSRMADTQEVVMHDRCKVGVLAQTADGPYRSDTFTYGDEIACGINQTPAGEASDGSEAGVTGVTCRLPLGTAVTSTSRVRVTKRCGTDTTDEDYAVEGDPHVGQTCIVVNLQRVHGARRG
jgi:predicted RecA/RadA family phage recombinase